MGNFVYNEPEKKEPIRIEQVFAEKPGGGVISCEGFVPSTTAVSEADSDGVHTPIKSFKVTDDAKSTDTTIKIEKGSGIAANDIVGHGVDARVVSAVDTSNDGYDALTIEAAFGEDIDKGTLLFEAYESTIVASGSPAKVAKPKYTPVYVTGNDREPDANGFASVRLINGANLRKETACVSPEVAALMTGIHLV